MQLLNNLVKVKVKKLLISCYMLTSLDFSYERNAKKLKKMIKAVNIKEQNLHIF